MTNKLVAGFEDFVRANYGEGGLMPMLVRDGQNPDYFIISCIDSRANPGTILNPKPGTFFAHKAMGAIVRPYKKGTALAAALQFALDHNNVSKIIVIGHTGCGAIRALVGGIEDEEISEFLAVAQNGLENAQHKCGETCSDDEMFRYAEEEIALLSARNLETYPSVARALKDGRVEVKAWLFDMENGALLEHNPNTETFEKIV